MSGQHQYKWEHLFSYSVAPGVGSNKQTLGPASPRTCRFCDRREPRATFRHVAHVIPAAFGNRSLFSNEECDECNSAGSRLESDLASFLALPRALSRIPARKGFPKIKSDASHTSFAQIQGEDRHLYVLDPTENEGVQLHDEDGQLRLTVKTPPHRPLNVARALGRMALFSYPRDCAGFDTLRDWVTGRYQWFPVPLCVVHLPADGNTLTVGFYCHRFTLAPGRNVIRCFFVYSTFLTVMPIALDKDPLPDGLPLIDYPREIAREMLESTSAFSIDSDFVEPAGVSEAMMSYRERVKVR